MVKNHEFLHLHLHVPISRIGFNFYCWNTKRQGELNMQEYSIDEKYYLNVASKMIEKGLLLEKPKHKSNFIYNDGEFLRIITVSCEI